MEKYNVKFKKKFGQNFLKDTSVVKKIVGRASITNEDLVIEVGPGGAILTRELCDVAGQVLAYEIDVDLKEELNNKLKNYNNVDVIYGDFLNADIYRDLEKYNYKDLFFVSNVPYYITTPILLKLINSGMNFKKIVMMVQKEVGDRFTTKPGSKDYGSISVLLNYYFITKKEFDVSRKEFVPEPNVDSVIVSFSPREDRLDLVDFDFFQKLVKDSFQYKRKNIRNNLKNYDLVIVDDVLRKYGFDLTSRAECLDYTIFVELANNLVSKK